MLQTTYRHIGRLAIFASLFLTACSSVPHHVDLGAGALVRPQVSGQSFWQQAALASDYRKVPLYLEAASHFLSSGKLEWAYRAMEAASALPLNDTQVQLLDVLRADYFVQKRRYREAESLLPPWSDVRAHWSAEQQRQWCQIQVKIARGQASLADQAVAWQRLADQYPVSDPHYREALTQLWETLVITPLNVLEKSKDRFASGTVPAGWLSLAIVIAKSEGAHSDDGGLTVWQRTYPNHPAILFLQQKKEVLAWHDLKKVALLLPLKGHFSEQGQAIRRGFYGAYYRSQATALPVVAIYDTSSNSVKELAKKAVQEGASLLIGPLLKKDVKNVAASGIDKPTLALNATDKTKPWLYQFALTPLVASDMIANRLAKEGRWHVVLIADDAPWAKRMADAFKKRWADYDGVVVGSLLLPDKQGRSLSSSIRHLLEVSASFQRKHELVRALGEKVRFIPSRREDIDAIVLFTRQEDAEQIKPFLRYYFAGDIPVYAGPSVYDRRSTINSSGDLQGIQFLTTPWQVMPSDALPADVAGVREDIQKAWPTLAKKEARFFAMGVDAFRLMRRLPWLLETPHLSLYGATGVLSVDEKQYIKRQLTWARFSQHGIKPVKNP